MGRRGLLLLAALGWVLGCGDGDATKASDVDEGGFPWPTDGWHQSTPEAEGMDPEVLDGVREYAFRDDRHTQAVVVIRHGKVVADWYAPDRDEQSWAASWSMAKSFTAAAIGIAIDEGLIESVDVPLADYYPDWLGTDKEDITLEDVLHMASGLDWVEEYSPGSTGSDIVALVATAKDHLTYAMEETDPIATPGTVFNYSSGDTMLLSGILEQATGMTAGEYAKEKIFAPLGINRVEWWTDAEGHTVTYCCLDMPSREFAKLGLLFLQGGKWDGEQIVSEAWVKATLSATGPYDGYGYQIWLDGRTVNGLPDDTFNLSGVDQQSVYSIPSLDLIVVRNGLYYKYDGPPVGDPFLLTRYPSDGLVDMEGTIGPENWRNVEFLKPVLDSIK